MVCLEVCGRQIEGAAWTSCCVTGLSLGELCLSIRSSHTEPVTCLSFLSHRPTLYIFFGGALLSPVCIWLWLFGKASVCWRRMPCCSLATLCICSNLQVLSWLFQLGLLGSCLGCRVMVVVWVVVAAGYHNRSYFIASLYSSGLGRGLIMLRNGKFANIKGGVSPLTSVG